MGTLQFLGTGNAGAFPASNPADNRTDRGFVHAHAGIGRVVETPGEPEWPVIGTYRKRLRKRKG